MPKNKPIILGCLHLELYKTSALTFFLPVTNLVHPTGISFGWNLKVRIYVIFYKCTVKGRPFVWNRKIRGPVSKQMVLHRAACKMNYVNIQHNYADMKHNYVDMQYNYVDIQHDNYINVRDNYVNMRFKVCCISTYLCSMLT